MWRVVIVSTQHDTTHACPGCAQPGVPRHMLACKRCWFRLPQDIRNQVNGTYYNRRRSARSPSIGAAVAAHQAALAKAIEWYRAHPVTP